MKTYEGMRYSKDHEWVREEEGLLYIGISNYAQLALGDLVFVELPELGKKLKAGDQLGVVESVKAASDIYSPASGEVMKVNEALTDAPELLNAEPYENWIAALNPEDPSEMDKLMNEKQYGEYCTKEG
mgnify:CR=1 FL=1